MDPAVYPNPTVYNPYYYRDIRSGATADNLGYTNKEQYQFVSVNKEHMGFGFGRHACPGRSFAFVEIKLILMCLLLDYKMKMPSGETGRYLNLKKIDGIMADPTKSVMFKYVGEWSLPLRGGERLLTAAIPRAVALVYWEGCLLDLFVCLMAGRAMSCLALTAYLEEEVGTDCMDACLVARYHR
ncbi:ent-kaurene oxidase [Microdochium nivale]|nr:ent-kaurene oxidase [Microdochium nivale]